MSQAKRTALCVGGSNLLCDKQKRILRILGCFMNMIKVFASDKKTKSDSPYRRRDHSEFLQSETRWYIGRAMNKCWVCRLHSQLATTEERSNISKTFCASTLSLWNLICYSFLLFTQRIKIDSSQLLFLFSSNFYVYLRAEIVTRFTSFSFLLSLREALFTVDAQLTTHSA